MALSKGLLNIRIDWTGPAAADLEDTYSQVATNIFC